MGWRWSGADEADFQKAPPGVQGPPGAHQTKQQK
jgi:hypothetical protein